MVLRQGALGVAPRVDLYPSGVGVWCLAAERCQDSGDQRIVVRPSERDEADALGLQNDVSDQREILTARDAGGFETKCQGETLIAPTETDDTDRAECIDTIGAEAATHVDLWHRVVLVIDSGGRATDSDNYAEIGKGHLERAAPCLRRQPAPRSMAGPSMAR